MLLSGFTVILPTKNEEECIGQVIADLQGIADLRVLTDKMRIIVVDDSDTKDTEVVARNQAAKGKVSFEFLPGAGNESPSIRKALEYCKTKYAIIVDADGSQDLCIIPQMAAALKDYDLVIGSRFCTGGDPGSTNRFSGVGNLFARRVLGLETKDTTGRYYAGPTALLLAASRWDGRGENSIDVVDYCERRKMEILEVPFTYKPRIGGKSKTKIAKYLRVYFGKVLTLRLDHTRPFSKRYITRGLVGDWIGEDWESEVLSVIQRISRELVWWGQIPAAGILSQCLKVPIFAEWWARTMGRGIPGFFLRACFWRTRLAFGGQDVFIDQGVTVFGPSHCVIDDGSFIEKGATLECSEDAEIDIGRCVHVGAYAYINGKPFVRIGDYSCIDCHCVVFGSSNRYRDNEGNRYSMSCAAPMSMQLVDKVGVVIGKFAFLGPNSVLVCASMGDYVIVGANSFVKADIPDGAVAAGSPAKIIEIDKKILA